MVDARHPVGVHGGLFLFGVFTAVALDLDDEVERVFCAVAVVHLHDEVRAVFARFGGVAVRHFQAEVVVLYIGQHLGVGLGDAAELGLPATVQNHPVELAAAAVGFT